MSLPDKLKQIKLLVLDVDGVLSDGSIVFNGDGTESKTFDVQDGFGITLARQAGLKTAILTGRVCPPVKRRAAELKIDYYEEGHFYKGPAIQKIAEKAGIKQSEILYIGDDILDLVCKAYVGVFVAPANAMQRVKDEADWVTCSRGGHGAVREMINTVLDTQNLLTETENYFIEQRGQ